MSIIRDVQDNNDTRDEIVIPQVDITPVQQSTNSSPIQQESILSQELLEEEPILPVSPPDMNNMESSVLRDNNLQLETSQQISAPNFDLMPTVNEVFLQNQQQALEELTNKLGNVPGTFVINGDVQPTLHEITETRGDLFRRDFDYIFPQTGEEIQKQLVKEQYTPEWGGVEYDPLGVPGGSSTDQIKKRGLVGLLNQVGNFTLGEKPPEGDKNEFAPFRGFRQLGKDIVENPLEYGWKAIFALPVGMAGGQYGEMGSGLLGSAFYNISLAQNAVVGAASSIYNRVNGKKDINIFQGVQGGDFSFTTQSSEDKPLSFVGTKENPQTYDALKKRSLLWQHPLFSGSQLGSGIVKDAPKIPGVLDVAEAFTNVFQREENKGKIPFIEKLPNRSVQTVEFINGLIADAVTDPLDTITGLFQRAAKNVDVIKEGSEPVRRLLGGTDGVPQLPGIRPDVPLLPSVEDADLVKRTRILQGDIELPSVVPETVQRQLPSNAEQTIDVQAREVTPDDTIVRQSDETAPDQQLPDFEPVDDATPPTPIEDMPERSLELDDYELLEPENTTKVGFYAMPKDSPDFAFEYLDEPVRPQLLPENQQLSLESALDSPSATVGQLEELLGKSIEPPQPSMRSTVIDRALSSADASSRVIGLLPPANTSDDILKQIIDPNSEVSRLLSKYAVNLEEFNPITRRTNSQLTSDIGLNRDPLSNRRLALSVPGSKELVNYKPSSQLPRVEYQETFTTKFLDNSLDEIIDNPNTIPDVINAQKEILPSNQRVFTREGQESLVRTLRNEQLFETFAKESEELKARFVRQSDNLEKSIDALDNLPDIGRRSIDDPLLTGVPNKPFKQVRRTRSGVSEIPYQRQPAEFYELDEFDLDDATRALAAEINNQKLFHGTKTVISADFSNIDPILGSSRSEIGTVIHVSNDSSISSIYAEASPNRNSPPVIGNNPRKIVDGGLIYEIQPQVQNPRLVSDPLDEIDVEVLKEAIKKTGTLEDARISARLARIPKKGRSYEDVINRIDEVLFEEFREFPEELALDIQRSITNDVRNVLGVDALVKRGKDGYLQIGFTGVPGRQSSLSTKTPTDLGLFVGDVPQTPIQRQAYMKYLGDKTTAGLYPDSKFSQVNELESLIKYQTEELNLTSMRSENVKKVAKITVDELLEQEQQLKQISDLEYRKSREAKEVQWKSQNDRVVKSFNSVEKGIC